jgi:hypothetical protein
MGTPYQELSKFSTQVGSTQLSTESLADMLSFINEFLPNGMSSTSIVRLINIEQNKLSRYLGYNKSDISLKTSSGIALYNLPSDCEIDKINALLVSDSTAITSTALFSEYSIKGNDEELIGNNYYSANNGTFGLYPVPENTGNNIYLSYISRPTQFLYGTSDTTTLFNIDRDYLDIIRYRVMSRVAKAGNNPDVELGNNYDIEADSVERRLKLNRAKKRFALGGKAVSYKEWK